MIICIGNSKDFRESKRPVRTDKWNQSTCRIQDQHTSVALLDISNELLEQEIKNTMSFALAKTKIL